MSDDSKRRAERKARQRQKEYERKLKAVSKIGAYSPKSAEITKYRKTRINKAYAEFAPYIEPTRREKFFFISAEKLDKAERQKFLENADAMTIAHTRKGIFLQKEGHTRAKIIKTTFEGQPEFVAQLTGKTKHGVNKGKRYEDRVPIANGSALEKARATLERQARAFGPLKKGEALSFVVVQNGIETGAHAGTHSTVDAVMRTLDKYHIDDKTGRDKTAAKLNFFRIVQIRKTTLTAWPKEHPSKRMARGKGRKKRKTPKGYNPH